MVTIEEQRENKGANQNKRTRTMEKSINKGRTKNQSRINKVHTGTEE